MRIATWGLAVLLLAPSGILVAGQQQDPLIAAARRAREQKKEQPKATKIWTNDDIPKSPDSVSVVGQPGTASATTPTDSPVNAVNGENKTEPSEAASPKNSSADNKKILLDVELSAAKENLQNLQNDLDILQRKFTLDQQMYFGKPDYSADKAGAAAIKDEQDQIDAKQQEMTEAQKKVADLQAQLNSATINTNDSSK